MSHSTIASNLLTYDFVLMRQVSLSVISPATFTALIAFSRADAVDAAAGVKF